MMTSRNVDHPDVRYKSGNVQSVKRPTASAVGRFTLKYRDMEHTSRPQKFGLEMKIAPALSECNDYMRPPTGKKLNLVQDQKRAKSSRSEQSEIVLIFLTKSVET